MKRSAECLNNNTTPASLSLSRRKGRAIKVSNSLSTDTAFAWPAATLLPPAEEYSNFTFTDDDLDADFGSDSSADDSESLSGDETLMLDLLTDEDWLEQEEKQEEGDSLLQLPSNSSQTHYCHYQQDAVLQQQQQQQRQAMMMDQECYDYFMAEYMCQKPQISFSEFVADSLDKIASFTQAAEVTNKSKRHNHNTVSSSSSSTSSFDFSIQNWQQKVVPAQQAEGVASQWHQWQWHEGLIDDDFQFYEVASF
jgi:hypothetical protein